MNKEHDLSTSKKNHEQLRNTPKTFALTSNTENAKLKSETSLPHQNGKDKKTSTSIGQEKGAMFSKTLKGISFHPAIPFLEI